jgi:hypothetical protein
MIPSNQLLYYYTLYIISMGNECYWMRRTSGCFSPQQVSSSRLT